MLVIISSVLGILATVLTWFLNPKRMIYAELDGINKQLIDLYVQRDKALQDNDSDTLTIVTAKIIVLAQRKAILIARLK